ncbi:hypothetical protein ACF09J_07225 [Streptomyces sp. NPDC014889]|uniref:hypothetical protein n=1 Tax=Streptomyces sp. NPDC014889 TaxID=3364928 RepID=UPI0036F963B3
MIAVVVLAASVHDNAVGIALLDSVAADTDTVEESLVDQGFENAVVAHGQTVGNRGGDRRGNLRPARHDATVGLSGKSLRIAPNLPRGGRGVLVASQRSGSSASITAYTGESGNGCRSPTFRKPQDS